MSIPDITTCPGTLAPAYKTYSPTCLKRLFNGRKVSPVLKYTHPSENEESAAQFLENKKRISISGVQEKISLILDKNKLRLSEEGEQGTYILKPIPRDLKKTGQLPANEHLTMQIARQVYGLNTAENALVFFNNGDPAYITKRFDVLDNFTKRGQEDFASLTKKTEETVGKSYKYTGSYEELAELVAKYTAAYKVEQEKIFSIIVFNYLFSNGDAHLKNFSLIETGDKDYVLSPAYDLINTRIHVADTDFALDLFKDDYESDAFKIQGYACFGDFEELSRRFEIGEMRFTKIMKQFMNKQKNVYTLINNSYLDENTKNEYKAHYEERLTRINRK